MTKTDKIIAAFLVSMGLFSVAQATQYVGALSDNEKATLVDVQQLSVGMDTSLPAACSIDGNPCQGGNGDN